MSIEQQTAGPSWNSWTLQAVYRAAEQACPRDPRLANFGTPDAPIPTPLMAAHVALQQPLRATLLLLAVFVAFYIWTHLVSFTEPIAGMSPLEMLGANSPPRISNGETFRLLMAVFLHRDLWHLIVNGLGLFFVAKYAEPLFGRARFLLVFFWGGISGNVLSYLFRDSGLSVGASGAILAELSALTLLPFRSGRMLPELARRRLLWTCLPWLLGSLWHTWSTPQIDVWGHVGGAIAGVVAGLTMHCDVLDPWSARRWPLWISSLVSASMAGWLVSRFVVFISSA